MKKKITLIIYCLASLTSDNTNSLFQWRHTFRTIDDIIYHSEVKPKDVAQREYNEAKAKGQTAGQVKQRYVFTSAKVRADGFLYYAK